MKSMKRTLYIIVLALLLIAFCVSAFLVIRYVVEGKQQEDRYNELSDIKNSAQTAPTTPPTQSPEPADPTETTGPQEPTEPQILDCYKELSEMNTDMVGWLEIDGTKLDYPVMQTPDDPQFYLYRDFDKNDSSRGSVFAWGEADINEPSDNITLFGHNMKDGSMFAALNAYTNKTTWENNPLIFFDTLTEYHTYEIFAVFKTSANLGGFAYHQFVDAADEAEFNEFVSTCKELAFYDTGITPEYGDKLICLSTCEYSLDNGRLVVAARRIV